MIEIILSDLYFSASHKTYHQNGTSSNVHGHDWHLKVFIQAHDLDEVGMTMNYQKLRTIIQEQVDQFDCVFLNDIPAFAGKNPTDEIMTREIFLIFSEKINTPKLKISAVELWHSDRRHIKYSEEVWQKDTP